MTETAYSEFHRKHLPVVYAVKIGNELRIWCEFCNLHHWHSPEPFGGPRVAHCFTSKSPYYMEDYYLKISHGHMGSLSKRVRFQVLSRDGFRCIYCGATARESKLHIDHKIPKSKGGSNDLSNLATACLDCNLGKGATI